MNTHIMILMKKILMLLYGFSFAICASECENKLLIEHLQKLASVALQNGLGTLADSYQLKARALAKKTKQDDKSSSQDNKQNKALL